MLPMFMLLLIILCTTIQPSKGWYQCNTGNNYTQGSPIIQNLQHVLGVLPNETASSNKGYHTIVYGQSPNTVYAMAMCRGDQTETQCRDCLQKPAASLQKLCGLMPGGRAMSDECFVRWKNSSFLSSVDLTDVILVNANDAFNTTANSLAVHNLFVKLIGEALQSNNTKRYAAGKAEVDSIHNIFGQVQCWGDVSDDDCRSWFASGADKIGMKEGSIAFTGNCYVEYEDHIFFVPPPPAPAVAPAPLNGLSPAYSISHKKKPAGKSRNKLTLILGSMGGFVLLLLFLVSGYCFIASRKQQAPHTMEVGPQTDYENRNDQNIHFSLETLIAATSNFHDNCKLGEGGFGIVYKGTLSNGEDVAIKKLSLRSSQGKQEFMAEIRFLTRVQHRNLVNLLGCCINGFERMLVYEYLANKSLHKHIFDLEKKRLLDWKKRMNIILGVAKGLLYLHEDSKLRIIHRDIKASNILLDNSFNAKIADFGLAKLFSEDESCINTRVAGTHGYMAPEYAMKGELSTKADVYSFGILVLEITSGRKINDFGNTEKNLLGWAWRSYTRGEFIKIVDEDLKEECNYEQILRCNHVGLLCTQADPSLRPLMSEVMMILSTKSVTLPNPTIPAFISTTTNSTFQNIETSSSSRNSIPHVSHLTHEMSASDSITTLEPR